MAKLFATAVFGLCLQIVFGASSFENECLSAHNKYRKKHGVPSVKIEKKLTLAAQSQADFLAETNSFQKNSGPYGQNIMESVGEIDINCYDVVEAWYDEIENYDFAHPDVTRQIEHFTQLVWKDTHNIGCAKAVSGDSAYVVCNYDPRGNYLQEFQSNVPRPK